MKTLLVARHVIRYVVIFALLLVFLAHAVVKRAADGRIYHDIESVPVKTSALLLGTSWSSRSGRPNRFFEHRIDAAAHLVRHGRVAVLVASGDNSHDSYNEPRAMQNALVDRGVPTDRIILDYAGFRTLDSVVRMHEVFQQSDFIVVSQEFHLERALFIAEARGIDAIGFAARDVEGTFGVRIREYAARVRAVFDVYVFGTQPRFLGDPVPIETDADSTLES
jgi:SanA protein